MLNGIKDRFWRFLASLPWDSSMSGNGYLLSLRQHGFLTTLFYTDEEREINFGSTQKLLDSLEARVLFFPFHTFRGKLLLVILGPSNQPPTRMMQRSYARISLDSLYFALRKGLPLFLIPLTVFSSTMTLFLFTSFRDVAGI